MVKFLILRLHNMLSFYDDVHFAALPNTLRYSSAADQRDRTAGKTRNDEAIRVNKTTIQQFGWSVQDS